MAIFKKGREICLSEAFFYYGVGDKNVVSSKMWRLADNVLMKFINRITYSSGGFHYGVPYLVDMMKGSESIFGVTIANLLYDLTLNNEKIVMCTDFINPYHFPVDVYSDNGINWKLSQTEDHDKISLQEDERYLVVIHNTEQIIHVYLFKKQ